MSTDAQRQRIIDKDYKVGIIGLGYVGLPLVIAFAQKGFSVLGFDIDAQKVSRANTGQSYIQHIPDKQIKDLVDSGLFEATADFSRAAEADALLICVPTPLTLYREPDLSYVISTAESIRPHLHNEHLVILESTTYPKTTEGVLREALERDDLKAGKDFYLAYSPEREDPGNVNFSTTQIPKVVGGFDEASLVVAQALYEQIVPETVPVSSAATAEAVKLTENIFRSVNIALVNELKIIYDKMGIDIWEVIEAAKTKPFGYMPFYPGPGLGGHCIPIDPFYLTWKAREYDCPTRFIELAGEINTAMPEYVVQRTTDELNQRNKSVKDARILILGLAYKKNVGDPRESPTFELMRHFTEKGANVDYYDPYIPEVPATRRYSTFTGKKSIDWNPQAIAQYDLTLIATAHDNIDYQCLADHAQLIIDTRNAMSRVENPKATVVRA